MKNLLCLLFVIFCFSCNAQEKAILLEPDTTPVLEEDKNLVWNKWDTSNFIILSLDKSQGLKIKANIERIRSSFLEKWNIQCDQVAKCKLICVPDKKTLSKFFNIEFPHVEVRQDTEGKVSLCAIWIDFDRLDQLPNLVSVVCLADGISQNRILWFVQRGISGLEKPVSEVKSLVSNLNSIEIKNLIDTDKEKWASFSPQDKDLFDRKSSLICLLLRKEFGDKLFFDFLLNQSGDFVSSLLKFKDQNHFNSTASRYSENLSRDINNNETPEDYLIVK